MGRESRYDFLLYHINILFLGSQMIMISLILTVDGGWGTWSPYGDCSVTCENGTRTRTRQCDNPPAKRGGSTCPAESAQYKNCSLSMCPSKFQFNPFMPAAAKKHKDVYGYRICDQITFWNMFEIRRNDNKIPTNNSPSLSCELKLERAIFKIATGTCNFCQERPQTWMG